jgi:hypothetical protein
MFGLWNGRKSSESFYRNIFALMTFVALGAAMVTHSLVALFAVLFFGMLSRTSVKNGWANPWFAEYVPWLYRKPREDPPALEKVRKKDSVW